MQGPSRDRHVFTEKNARCRTLVARLYRGSVPSRSLGNGIASLGKVTATRVTSSSKQGTTIEVTIDYEVDGVSTASVYRTLSENNPPSVGAELWVVYDAQQPARIAVLPR